MTAINWSCCGRAGSSVYYNRPESLASVRCSKEFSLSAKKFGQFFSFNLCNAAWDSESFHFTLSFAVIGS
jgi:hypothetical protein